MFTQTFLLFTKLIVHQIIIFNQFRERNNIYFISIINRNQHRILEFEMHNALHVFDASSIKLATNSDGAEKNGE